MNMLHYGYVSFFSGQRRTEFKPLETDVAGGQEQQLLQKWSGRRFLVNLDPQLNKSRHSG